MRARALAAREAGPVAAKAAAPTWTGTVARAVVPSGSAGRPLDRAARALLERRFGHDFGQVRVHTDAAADWPRGSWARGPSPLGGTSCSPGTSTRRTPRRGGGCWRTS
jgi:Domain of unknown function (DUF4157)